MRSQPARKRCLRAFFPLFSQCILLLAFIFIPSTFSFSANYGGTFIGAYKDEPSVINPLVESSSVGSIVNQIVFDGLITISPSGEISPRLAERWTVSENRLIWTFYLRNDVEFHDGERLTAKDVKFTYDLLLEQSDSFSSSTLFRNVAKIKEINEFTVEFTLKNPGSNFLLDLYTTGVLPKHIIKEHPFDNNEFNRMPIGTGPFKVASWKGRKEIVLDANDEYFSGRPYLDHIKLVYVPDIPSMWRMLQLGKIDGIYNEIMPVDFEFLKNNPELATYRLPDYMNYVIVFNFKKKIFQDKRMRAALNNAIDRKEIIEKALLENGVECNGIFRPGAGNDSNENVFDPEGSIKLLNELGYIDSDGDGILDKKGKKLSFKILIDANNVLKRKALLYIQNQLSQIGVEIVGEELPIPQIYAKSMIGDFDLIFFNYNTWLDFPVIFWHTSGINSRQNVSLYSNTKTDALFDKLMATQDSGKRTEIMKQIHSIACDDVAGVFLFVKYNQVAVNSRIHGFVPDDDKFFWEFATKIFIPKELQGK